MKLYDYYRSTASYRVRIALNYKNIEFDTIKINLLEAEQKTAGYKTHNPQGRVPTLVDNNFELGQSIAILEYLEEKYPMPNLLPVDKQDRAWVRYVANIIACDIHPLNNSGTLNYIKNNLQLDQDQINNWRHHWLRQGFDALETVIKNSNKSGQCCFGNTITFADICLIPQIYSAVRFEFPMDAYPNLVRINEYCLTLPYVVKAKPEPNSAK